MINPGMMMKLMNAKNTFESNHPKFASFVGRFFMVERSRKEPLSRSRSQDPVKSLCPRI